MEKQISNVKSRMRSTVKTHLKRSFGYEADASHKMAYADGAVHHESGSKFVLDKFTFCYVGAVNRK